MKIGSGFDSLLLPDSTSTVPLQPEAEASSVQRQPDHDSDSHSNSSQRGKKAAEQGIFASYKRICTPSSRNVSIHMPVSTLIASYIDCISKGQIQTWDDVSKNHDLLYPLLEMIFCVTATSAPVERIFSQSGLFMRPHRARMGDKNLCNLVYAKCNKHIIGTFTHLERNGATAIL